MEIQNTMSFITNIKEVSKYINKEVSELENISIKDIKQLVEDKNKQVKDERVTLENIERYAKFFSSWELFMDLFGSEIIPYIIKNINFSDITKEEFFVGDCFYKNSEFIRKGTGSYIPPRCRKPRQATGNYYLVPSDFQGLKHEKVIRAFLKDKYSEIFEKLKVEIYEIRENVSDIYISYELENGEKEPCVYVPIKALMTRDIDAIIERHTSYFASYNNGFATVTEDKKRVEREKLENMNAFKILKEILA